MTDLVREGVRAREDLQSLQYVLVGESAVPVEVLKALMPIATPAIAYGSTEAGLVAITDWPTGKEGS